MLVDCFPRYPSYPKVSFLLENRNSRGLVVWSIHYLDKSSDDIVGCCLVNLGIENNNATESCSRVGVPGSNIHLAKRIVTAGHNVSPVDVETVLIRHPAVAERYAKGRMVSMLEGGYALSALGRSAVQHIKVMAGLS